MNFVSLTLGMMTGACMMFLLDPRAGRRRRALMRDWRVHAQKVGERQIRRKTRDLKNRTHGLIAEGISSWRHGQQRAAAV